MSSNPAQAPSSVVSKSGSFKHKPLDHTKPSIRILQVLPFVSIPDGLIQCTITHSTVDTEYTCLSYVWGKDDGRGGTILLDGQTFQVRHNLHEFLKTARKLYPGRQLWIDAICIDQTNIEERNHQVQQMGDIYSRAKEVITWLGEDPLLGEALELMKIMRLSKWSPATYCRLLWAQAKKRKCLRGQQCVPVLLAAVDEYWSRAWITQEIALARQVKILGHTTEMEWTWSFHEKQRVEHRIWELNEILEHRFWELRQECDLGFRRLGFGGLDSLWFGSQRKPREMSLLYWLRLYHGKKCELPRDRIYSLLALSSDRVKMPVDYQLDDMNLFRKALVTCESLHPKEGYGGCLCSAIILLEALNLLNQPMDNADDLDSLVALTFALQRVEDDSKDSIQGGWIKRADWNKQGGWIKEAGWNKVSGSAACSNCGFRTTSDIPKHCRVFCFSTCYRWHGHLLWEHQPSEQQESPQTQAGGESLGIRVSTRWWTCGVDKKIMFCEYPMIVPASYTGTTWTIHLPRSLLKALVDRDIIL